LNPAPVGLPKNFAPPYKAAAVKAALPMSLLTIFLIGFVIFLTSFPKP
jgi:hypothetical protein